MTTQALANKLISIAEIRKDAVAFISPDKSTFITGSTAKFISRYY